MSNNFLRRHKFLLCFIEDRVKYIDRSLGIVAFKKLSFSLHLYCVSPPYKSIVMHCFPQVIYLVYITSICARHLGCLLYFLPFLTIFITNKPDTDMNISLFALTKMNSPSMTLMSQLRARKSIFMNKLLSPKLSCRMNVMTNFLT